MKKKIISLLAALAISATMLPAGVMAGSSITLESFNATKSAIMLDFGNASAAAEVVSLHDTTNPIVITKMSKKGMEHPSFTMTNTERQTNSSNTVVLEPEEGIDTEALYMVEAGGVDTGWFQVEEVFFDDFTVTRDSEGNLTAPYYTKDFGQEGKPNVKLHSKYWTVANAGNRTNIDEKTGKLTMMGTGASVALVKAEAGLSDITFDEYTVEADIEMPKQLYSGVFSVVLKSAYADYSGKSNGYDFEVPTYDLQKDWDKLETLTLDLSMKKDNTEKTAIAGYNLPKSYRGRYVVANGKAEWYIDSDKVGEFADTISGEKNIVTFGPSVGSNKNFTLDNVSITKIKPNQSLKTFAVAGDPAIDGDSVVFGFSEEIDENIKNAISFTHHDAECEFDVSATGTKAAITPDEALEDGVYVLTLKKGMPAKGFAFLADDYQIGLKKETGVWTIIPVERPMIENVAGAVGNEKFTLTYDYSGGENASELKILAADNEDGPYTEIYSDKLTGNTEGSKLELDRTQNAEIIEKFVDKYIRVEISPKSELGFSNTKIVKSGILGMFRPTVSNVEINDNFESGSIEVKNTYNVTDMNGDNAYVDVQWYVSDSIDGTYAPISGATNASLDTSGELRDKFVKVYVTPKSNDYPYEGDVVVSDYYCRYYKPEALDVKINGEAKLTATLTGTYKYNDNNDKTRTGVTESGTICQWLISETKGGPYTPTDNTTDTYTLTDADVDKFLIFEVAPKKTGMTEEPDVFRSAEFTCPARPYAENVKIDGSVKVGNTVTGNYSFKQVFGVAQGESILKWYINGGLAGEGISFTIPAGSEGTTLEFEVTPVAVQEPKQGSPVKSGAVGIGAAESYGGSGGTGSSGSSGNSGGPSKLGGNVSDRDADLLDNDVYGDSEDNTPAHFGDVDESHWAFEYVDYLHNHGIVSGNGQNNFMPEKSSLRVEIAKMLCIAFDLKGTAKESVFDDVKSSSWYAPYVIAAYENNVVKGVTGNLFGVDSNVTRQELCTMLYRLEDNKVTGSELTFSDSDQIAPYAKEAVAYYAGKGIIKGYGDNTFRPTQYCTRAETAKIICAVIRH